MRRKHARVHWEPINDYFIQPKCSAQLQLTLQVRSFPSFHLIGVSDFSDLVARFSHGSYLITGLILPSSNEPNRDHLFGYVNTWKVIQSSKNFELIPLFRNNLKSFNKLEFWILILNFELIPLVALFRNNLRSLTNFGWFEWGNLENCKHKERIYGCASVLALASPKLSASFTWDLKYASPAIDYKVGEQQEKPVRKRDSYHINHQSTNLALIWAFVHRKLQNNQLGRVLTTIRGELGKRPKAAGKKKGQATQSRRERTESASSDDEEGGSSSDDSRYEAPNASNITEEIDLTDERNVNVWLNLLRVLFRFMYQRNLNDTANNKSYLHFCP